MPPSRPRRDTRFSCTDEAARFEPRPISFAAREQHGPAFLALNPMGKVPVLVIDGRPLTEVAGILFYLARAFPDARLLPADAEGDPQVSRVCPPSPRPCIRRAHPPVPAVLAGGELARLRALGLSVALRTLRPHDGARGVKKTICIEEAIGYHLPDLKTGIDQVDQAGPLTTLYLWGHES
jgi:Glutathione S-transferase, N-terminal domain